MIPVDSSFKIVGIKVAVLIELSGSGTLVMPHFSKKTTDSRNVLAENLTISDRSGSTHHFVKIRLTVTTQPSRVTHDLARTIFLSETNLCQTLTTISSSEGVNHVAIRDGPAGLA